MNISEAKRVHIAVMQVYCAVAGTHYADHISARKVVDDNGFTLPALLVRQSRLSLFTRVVQRAPVQLACLLWAVRSAPRSWLESVVADVRFLKTGPKFTGLAGRSPPLSQLFFESVLPPLFSTRMSSTLPLQSTG